MFLLAEHLRVDGVSPEIRRDDHELAHELRMTESREEGHASAERIAHEIDLPDLQVLDQRGDVAGHQLRSERPIDVGCAAMTLQIGDDDLVSLRERG